MKLIDILVRELPGLGGWPPGAYSLYQNAKGRLVGTRGCIVYTVDMTLSVVAENTHRSVTREQYEAALAARKPEWDGEGLPKAGVECEWQDKNTKAWIPVVIAYSSEWVTVVRELTPSKNGDAVECCINNFGEEERLQFRPIRSELDKKRYAAIEALFEILDAGISTSQDSIDIYDAIAAGKVPGIRID